MIKENGAWELCLLCRKMDFLSDARKISPLSVSLSAMKWGRAGGEVVLRVQGGEALGFVSAISLLTTSKIN
jgi:hypothetical protein